MHCPRCDYVLYRPRSQSITKTFALSLAGLFLLFPANFLPIMGIKFLGKAHEGTIWEGVTVLFQEGMWFVALLVFLASIFFPVINMTFSLMISSHLYFGWQNDKLNDWMRYLERIEEWAMLEVYLLGIIVACVKLSSMADLKLGLGLTAFVLLLIMNILLASNFDSALFWQGIDEVNANEKK
jgi:paraquat-inducible protein A